MLSYSPTRQATLSVLGGVLGCALLVSPARGSESYFMVIFSAQRQDGSNPAHEAHSFGTFAKLTGDGGEPERFSLDSFTVSWLPQTGDVHLWRLPETGHNLDLPTSFAWARDHGLCVSMWGPYQIEKRLYERAEARSMELESGKVRYKAIDTGFPAARVTNCIHALSDISFNKKRLRLGSPSWGDPASYFIIQSFRPWIIDENCTHDWLLGPLGLDKQPVIRRDLASGNPEDRPVQRVLQNIAHAHLLRHVRP